MNDNRLKNDRTPAPRRQRSVVTVVLVAIVAISLLFLARSLIISGTRGSPFTPSSANPPELGGATPGSLFDSESRFEADNPAKDGWPTEVFSAKAKKQLDKLGELLLDPQSTSSIRSAALVTAEFSCGALLPESLNTVFQDDVLHVRRAQIDDRQGQRTTSENSSDATAHAPIVLGTERLTGALARLVSPFASKEGLRYRFKIFAVDVQSDAVTTRQYFSLSGQGAGGPIEQNATWTIRWTTTAADKNPRMDSVIVEDFEMVETNTNSQPLFSDCTGAALTGNACFEQQILKGMNHWQERSQQLRFYSGMGTPGMALGDVNGDGLEDLYVCQEEGLPNLLFLHQADGTVLDVSAAWGVDWLQDSRSALLIDWDNDGDQDLAVAILGGLVLAENNQGKGFTQRTVLPTSEDTMSLSSADFDNDGDLDLYVCSYNRGNSIGDEPNVRIPAASGNFVFHDANTGGRNSAFRNLGDGKFVEASHETGLDQNNHRYSFASAWEDYDNDGDIDLYVANDYGRDSLYRNDDGHFVDVAEQANVEDSASGMGVTWGDFNRDGYMDVHVSNMWSSAGSRITYQQQFKADASPDIRRRLQRMARGNTLLENRGDGTFDHVSGRAAVEVGRWAWSSNFVDLNNDGWEDLVVANGMITTPDSGDL